MTAVCELNSTLKDAVSGFLRGRFTRTVFMSIRNDFTRATRKEEVTLVILPDFCKAFDTVQYKLLITKPDLIGLSKPLLSWLTSYLLDRSQYVQIDETAPILICVQFSVPQGSILGSMLFIFHFSDLRDNLPANVASYQYADDATVYASCHPNDPPQKTEDLNCVLNARGLGLLILA